MLEQVWPQIFGTIEVRSNDCEQAPSSAAAFTEQPQNIALYKQARKSSNKFSPVLTLVACRLFHDLTKDFIPQLRVSVAVLPDARKRISAKGKMKRKSRTHNKDSVDTVDFRLILSQRMIAHVTHDGHEAVNGQFVELV